MRQRITKLSRSLVTVGPLLALVSCGTHNSDPDLPTAMQVETINRITSRWIANPAVDLMSPEGTFIRAAMESQRGADLSLARKRDALEGGGFPGFARAFHNPELADEYFSISNKGWVYAGTDYFEVVEFSGDGKNWTAAVCNYRSMTASKRPGRDTYETVAGATNGFGSIFTFGPDPELTTEQQRTPPGNQRGPENRPTNDVFGTWVITDITPVVEGRLHCGKPAPGTPPGRSDPVTSPDPPPSLPPEPGWPSASPA